MACSKLTSDGDPSVYVRTDYQSCLGDDFLQIGILLGNTYVKQGDLVTEEYYHYMKLEAIRVKTVAGGGLSSKLADVLSTQDNFFTVSHSPCPARHPARTLLIIIPPH